MFSEIIFFFFIILSLFWYKHNLYEYICGRRRQIIIELSIVWETFKDKCDILEHLIKKYCALINGFLSFEPPKLWCFSSDNVPFL